MRKRGSSRLQALITPPTTAVLVDVDGVIVPRPQRPADVDPWPSGSWREEMIAGDTLLEGVHVAWSTHVVEGLRQIEASPGVTMLWCTTWTDRARTVLAPMIGIGHSWPVLGRGDCGDPNGPTFDWWKATRAWEALRAYDRVVWMDDGVSSWSNGLTLEDRDDEWAWARDKRLLCVCPDESVGLAPDNFAEVDAFLWGGND